MGLLNRRMLSFLIVLGAFLTAAPALAQDEAGETAAVETRRPDSPSIHIDVMDMPSLWASLRETRLRQSIDALFAIPFIAGDESIASLTAGLETIAERGGIEPTFDSLLGENTHSVRLILFEEDMEEPTAPPYILDATMASAELAQAVSEVLQANLTDNGTVVRAAGQNLTATNAPERMVQDRMADWRTPFINEALELAPLQGAQVKFFGQPARDEEPGGGDKVSAGHIRFQPERIDISMHALPVHESGSLRVPTAEGLAPLDQYVVLADQPHVFSMAFHGAASLLENASRDSRESRGYRIVRGLERYTGASVEEMLEIFGEDANLALNSLSVRGMFDFNVGVTGAWQVLDSAKAGEFMDNLKQTHEANLRRDAESYGRSTDGLRFRQEEHRGMEIWSAPLMIFPIQPSTPPTLNLALSDDTLLMATSRRAMTALIDRYLDGSGDASAIERAREGHDLPHMVHSLGTVDFSTFSEVFRASVPVIVAVTQGGQEAQTFGRAFADVLGALGHGTATGIYESHGQSVRASLLLAPPNPAP